MELFKSNIATCIHSGIHHNWKTNFFPSFDGDWSEGIRNNAGNRRVVLRYGISEFQKKIFISFFFGLIFLKNYN